MAICKNLPCTPDCDFYFLDQFTMLASQVGYPLELDDFMFMGIADRGIHLYKHYDTRRYLNLDATGHAFRFGEGYTPYDNPVEAIQHVLS